MYVGIDLALRNTGIVALSDECAFLGCGLISSDPKKYNNEDLLIYNHNQIADTLLNLFDSTDKVIGLEGLAFNSTSASVDLIAANHWNLRCYLKNSGYIVKVIPPKSWQKAIINKDVLAEQTKHWPTVRAKRGQKLTKEEVSSNNKSKAERRKDTKLKIYNSVPDDVKDAFDKYIADNKLKKDVAYDLADAYSLAKHLAGLK